VGGSDEGLLSFGRAQRPARSGAERSRADDRDERRVRQLAQSHEPSLVRGRRAQYADCVGAGHLAPPSTSEHHGNHPGVDMSDDVSAPPATAPPSDRERRALRCGEPDIHGFDTEDGVRLRLSRYRGGGKGPVILSPGFGTSALAYTLDTTDTNLPEYLFERGYDVWILDYRASPALPSASTQFSLDEIARYDYPAAVETVRAVTGADSVQIMAHCIGSLTMLMSLSLGLAGVRSAVASQLTLHPRAGTLNELRAGIYAADVIDTLGLDSFTTEIEDDPSWLERLYDRALAFYPAGDEPCERPFCRRVMFMYGEVYDHDNLNEATHDHLPEAFGVANLKTFRQISQILRDGHAKSDDGSYAYLDGTAGLGIPISFIHGERNRLFLPEGSELTYDFLRARNDPALYSRHVIPGYAHMDCFIGRNAARDVYPLVTAQLDLHN
jgi:pimeloyl-ACP methyl ester carboxylesterase